MRRPLSARRAPKATISELAGAADHCARLISCGEPGRAWGAMDLETMSKMPAFCRSLKSVESKVALSTGVCGSVPTGLKSDAARRMRALPRLVPAWTQSCAWRAADEKTSRAIRGRRNFVFMIGAILPCREEVKRGAVRRGRSNIGGASIGNGESILTIIRDV